MIKFIDHTDYRFTRKSLSLLRKDTLFLLDYLSQKYRKPFGNVSIAFLTQNRIQDLHYRYLKKKNPTDILTFKDNEASRPSGDIAICPYRVLLYAFKDCRQPVSWFYHTLLHGLLHLYGLEHDYSFRSIDRVYRLQESILKKNHLHEETVYGIFEKIILYSPNQR